MGHQSQFSQFFLLVVFLFAKAALRENVRRRAKAKIMQLGAENEPAFKTSSRQKNSALKKNQVMTFARVPTAGTLGQGHQKAELLLYSRHSNGHGQELGYAGTSSVSSDPV